MRNDKPSAVSSDFADALELGESTDAADVRLQDIEFASVCEVEEFPVRVLQFAGRDRNRRMIGKIGVPVEVVDVDGSLEEEHVKRFEPLNHSERFARVRPAIAD